MPETVREGTKKFLWKTNVDVKGVQQNINEVNHLINNRLGKPPNRSVLDFELNLRTYKDPTGGDDKRAK